MSPVGSVARELIKLRGYQQTSIEQVREAIREKKRRIILTIPTGGGKTFTAAFIIVSALGKGKRSLFVAHRLELIDQTVRAFFRLGITQVGVIRAGDKRADLSQPIQVASIQTLARRKQDDFDIVIIDEGHRALAKTYVKHLFERHPKALFIIITATPIGPNGKTLKTIADVLIIGAKYSELIEQGSIAAPLCYSTPKLADMSTVRTSAGEFNQADLEAAMNRGSLIGDIFDQWSKHPRQRTVAFAVSVAHSKAIVQMLVERGVRAEHLDGETPEDERRAILARLESFETEVVSNVGCLTEGWDLPACKTIILACPTKSLSKFMQMAGRGLRPWEDVVPIVIDHGGNIDRHGWPHQDRAWRLDEEREKTPGAPPVKTCESCFAYVAASARVCPHCGAPFVVVSVAEAEPVIVDLALRTLEPPEGDEAKLKFFRALYKKCRDRGYKFGAVVHRYRERFAEEPQQAWIDALKADYRTDGEWKARIKRVQAERREREFTDSEAST